ncbi:MAG: four helix bundle protein [Gemmatimonadota bacterium]
MTESWERDPSGLVGQLRRAALSIASNIAEGCSRPTDRDFAKFLEIAIGSTSEVHYQLQYARDAGIAAATQIDGIQSNVVEVRRMLFGLLRAVRARIGDSQARIPSKHERPSPPVSES